MKTVYLIGLEAQEGLAGILERNSLSPVEERCNADILIYKGALEDVLASLKQGDHARKIIPYDAFLMNQGAQPLDLSGQQSLRKWSFDGEDIRGVSEKIGEMIDGLDSGAHFGELARYMKLNAIELTQNALIHKRMAGKSGKIDLEIFETSMFYNLCVSDPFGALSGADILNKLSRVCSEKTYETKESGAGLGLYMVLNASDWVIFKLKSEMQTQVCCIINKYKRLKQFKSKSPALFIYEE